MSLASEEMNLEKLITESLRPGTITVTSPADTSVAAHRCPYGQSVVYSNPIANTVTTLWSSYLGSEDYIGMRMPTQLGYLRHALDLAEALYETHMRITDVYVSFNAASGEVTLTTDTQLPGIERKSAKFLCNDYGNDPIVSKLHEAAHEVDIEISPRAEVCFVLWCNSVTADKATVSLALVDDDDSEVSKHLLTYSDPSIGGSKYTETPVININALRLLVFIRDSLIGIKDECLAGCAPGFCYCECRECTDEMMCIHITCAVGSKYIDNPWKLKYFNNSNQTMTDFVTTLCILYNPVYQDLVDMLERATL